jgi:UDP-N-acetylmuramate dehydrogenase
LSTARTLWPCAALSNAPLAGLTNMKVGGAAEWLLEPATPEELRDAVGAARERGMVPRILGGGANLVVADGVLPGVVIGTSRMNMVMRPQAPDHGAAEALDQGPDARVAPSPIAEDPRLACWAGVTMVGLVNRMRRLGLTGLEMLAGVPGHIGGGVAMNAGGRGWEVWSAVELVRLIDPDGTFRDLPREEASPSYRNGNLGEAVVAGVVLRFGTGSVREVGERINEYMRAKNATQPVTAASAGCVFKNPDPDASEGLSAGQLVDACGLKGRRVGAAEVSERHANFITNTGGATATEVLALMDLVRDEVAAQRGVELEFEVKRWLPAAAG